MIFLQLPKAADVPADSVLVNKLETTVERVKNMTWDDFGNSLLHFGGRLLIAVALFFVGRWLIRRIDAFFNKVFERRSIDRSLNSFIRSILRITAWLFLIMSIVSILGIKTTSFLAIFASAGFAIGMALSGTLQNFAGGVLILLLKPFRTGDYIVAQGNEGTVKEINLFNTVLVTADNKTIIVPNGGMSTSIINNVSASGTRRVEWKFGISYGDDYDMARRVLGKLLEEDKRIFTDPAYFIALSELADSAVLITVRAWTKSDDFWSVFFDMNEKVYKEFPKYGLTIPFRQMDITINTPDSAAKALADIMDKSSDDK